MVLLFGTGLGSAFYKWMADRSGQSGTYRDYQSPCGVGRLAVYHPHCDIPAPKRPVDGDALGLPLPPLGW